jgi:hypothetical protein
MPMVGKAFVVLLSACVAVLAIVFLEEFMFTATGITLLAITLMSALGEAQGGVVATVVTVSLVLYVWLVVGIALWLLLRSRHPLLFRFLQADLCLIGGLGALAILLFLV